jgi:hypothetical protein
MEGAKLGLWRELKFWRLGVSEVQEPEVGMPEPEVGIPEPEVGMPELDVGMPELEVWMPELDVGTPELDVGMPEPDVGILEPDVGIPEPEVEVSGNLTKTELMEIISTEGVNCPLRTWLSQLGCAEVPGKAPP